MSLSKKDPSLRVAANDPHLVSLGGGRLSTAVTIHNIPVGDCTIGSSLQCSVSLSGAGVRPLHCTIYRSEENQVTLVPERNARILIDNQFIKNEVDLRQGAMITIGDSYYLRYNNPAEAMQMRCAMEESSEAEFRYPIDDFYESIPPCKSRHSDKPIYSYYDNLKKTDSSQDLMEWQCPKVFTADLVTVNMSAKDVLGQKYANFAKNLAEHHRIDKNLGVLNTNTNIASNTAINNSLTKCKELLNKGASKSTDLISNDSHNISLESKINEKDPLEDMLKICAEYTDRQDRPYGGNSSITSSPVIQNRIKTNGSLPRDKKSPFYQELQNSFTGSNNSLSHSPKSSGYENVQPLQQHIVEIGAPSKSSGYENIKLVPQSPRTKIRTTCISPKIDFCEGNITFNNEPANTKNSVTNYENLIKNFEENFKKEIEAIEESSMPILSKISVSNDSSPAGNRRTNKNVNNLTIDIKSFISPYNSPTFQKKPTPAPRKITKTEVEHEVLSKELSNRTSHEKLQEERENLLQRIRSLKTELSSLQMQDNETLIEMDMEHALIVAEMHSQTKKKEHLQEEYHLLQQKIYRLEAQRNSTRVMEENQQSKLKHSIEMKEDQVEKLKELLKNKPDNMCLKEELSNVRESLENDKKYFEDLEFQYLEGESEWQAYRDDLNLEEQSIIKKIKEYQLSIEKFEKQEKSSFFHVSGKQRRLSTHLIFLINELHQCEEQFKMMERKLNLKISSNSSLTEPEEIENLSTVSRSKTKIMPSLFGSTEILCHKTNNDDLMSKSLNENMIYNNKIKLLKNELTVNNAKLCKENVELKDNTGHNYDAIKKIENQRQLLDAPKELRNLDYERRKIEELLKKLNVESSSRSRSHSSVERDIIGNEQSPQKDLSLSPISTSSHFSSESRSDICNKLSIDIINKPNNKLNMLSSESPKTYRIDEKCSSSILSNELPSQPDSAKMCCDRKKTRQQKQQRPLTRYLPIFTEDLDLKRHIESAGHPISLCHHVFLDAYRCRGYLQKLGSRFHTWSKRWFVLDRRQSALIYYAEKSERKPRGGAYFSSINEVYMDHLNASKSSRPHSTFIVKTKKRRYYLQASSDTAARIWIDAIITGAQGNIDYC